MATGTAWYNLTKPAATENYDLSVWNRNLDMIDAQMHQNETETFNGATALADGTVGNVPAPLQADKDKFLKGDGTWDTPSGGSDMTGATASNPGTHGLVPAPSAGDNTKYLKGDGTWDTPSGGGGSSSLSGLTDVDLSSPTNGQVLKYNSTTSKWENADESGGSGSYSTTTLFTGNSSTTSGELTLSDSIRNYDMLMFVIGWPTTSTEAQASFLIDTNYFANTYIYNNGGTTIADPHMFCCTYSTSYLRIKCGSANDKILIYDSTDTAVYKILGVKYGGGSGSGGTQITVVERTDNTTAYAWLNPKDANGNDLSSDDVTILSLVGIADMSGAPPYYNGLNLQIDSDSGLYFAKLYNSQTGSYASDGVYSVTYRVAYIQNN